MTNLSGSLRIRRKTSRSTFIHVISDSHHALDRNDEGLVKDGTEKHLQEWLADNLSAVGEGFTLLPEKSIRAKGTLIFSKDALDSMWQWKNAAMSGAWTVYRYLSALEAMDVYGPIKGMIVALDV
jgi:RecB family endonuclease NucS